MSSDQYIHNHAHTGALPWLSVRQNIVSKVLVYPYKGLTSLAPDYLVTSDNIQPSSPAAVQSA